ncbi:hypothetical protein ElyMa_004566900 [Elysia marginata]|uniref:Ig-like domain-containing protein n=1 Tax=Elysia marginata TaxID=1093978 RepID=A0AAV4HSH7_9GAST|nr:hypothetical protein ElyMa_004566900 [Elysia marginata]
MPVIFPSISLLSSLLFSNLFYRPGSHKHSNPVFEQATEQNIHLKGVNPKLGSIKLAVNNGPISSQEESARKDITSQQDQTTRCLSPVNLHHQNNQEESSRISDPSYLTQPKNSATNLTLQTQQEEIAPPLPTSPIPSRPVTGSSDFSNQAHHDRSNTKCVCALQFTPSYNQSESSPETESSLQPVVFNFALSDSASSPKSQPASVQQEANCVEDTPGVSDSSKDENDDVFTDHLEVDQEERRGSLKMASSVFAWEKIPSKSPETSPFAEHSRESKQTNSDLRQVTKKKTCFDSDRLVESKRQAGRSTKVTFSGLQHKSSSSSPKTPSSSSKPKSVPSTSSDAEFTKIKLKSTGAKAGPSSDLQKSKFLSTSTESLFFKVKLKPVVIKDDELAEESSLTKNSFSIKSKSKSSGDLLRDFREERVSGNPDEVQTARETSGFSEKLNAFENKGNKTDRTDISRKPNYTIPKRNVVSKLIGEANKKEEEKLKSRTESPSNGILANQNVITKNSSSTAKTQLTHIQQPKPSSTLPRNYKAPGLNELNSSAATGQRHSVDIVSRMETVPSWVKEKAQGKRSSLTVESGAATLPMRSGNNVQSTRDRITKLKENPDAPKTPRRFKRDKPQPEDKLSKTLGSENLHRSSVRQADCAKGLDKGRDSDIQPKNDTDKAENKPGVKPDSNSSAPAWMQRRHLKPVEPSPLTESRTELKVNTSNNYLHNHSLNKKPIASPFSSLVSRFDQTSTPSVSSSHAKGYTNLQKNSFKNIENKAPKREDSLKLSRDKEIADKYAPENELYSEGSMKTATRIVIDPSPSPTQMNDEIKTPIVPDTKSEFTDKQQTERENSFIAGTQPPKKETTIPARSSTVKPSASQEISALNSQPSLRNTAVRPAWKKQRSLRHIPIYPIHDNELSPRYEPFIDDSESTASISSTSSEASIVTNDSGYYSQSRANTSDLKPNPSKDPQYQPRRDTQELLKPEDEHKCEDVEVKDRDVEIQKEVESRGDGQGELYSGGRPASQTLTAPTSSVIDCHPRHENQGDQHIADSLRGESLEKDLKTVPSQGLTRVGTQIYSDVGESSQDSSKSTNNTPEVRQIEKELAKENCSNERVPERPASPDIEHNTVSNTDAPSRQSLNLKNKVSYLESTDEKPEPETEPIISYPRRRSKFMDDYLNGRRGSAEAAQTAADKPDLDAQTDKPPAKRPVDLDISTDEKPEPEIEPIISYPRRRSKFMDDYLNGRRGSAEAAHTAADKPDLDAQTDKPSAKRPVDLDIVPKWKTSAPAPERFTTSGSSQVKDNSRQADPKNGLSAIDNLAEKHAGNTTSVPAFKRPLEDMKEVVNGSRAILSCTVSGYPLPQVEWLFNRQPLQVRAVPLRNRH